MKKYCTSREYTIEAEQYFPGKLMPGVVEAIIPALGNKVVGIIYNEDEELDEVVLPGDWVIDYGEGETYRYGAYKDETFRKCYEEVK